jgi:hypothetical protein
MGSLRCHLVCSFAHLHVGHANGPNLQWYVGPFLNLPPTFASASESLPPAACFLDADEGTMPAMVLPLTPLTAALWPAPLLNFTLSCNFLMISARSADAIPQILFAILPMLSMAEDFVDIWFVRPPAGEPNVIPGKSSHGL